MRPFLIALVIAWVVLVVSSVIAPDLIDHGPNSAVNFQGLNIFFMMQIAAFCVAIVVAILTWRSRFLPRGLRTLGFAPLAITVAIIAGIALVTAINEPWGDEPGTIRAPAVPIEPISG